MSVLRSAMVFPAVLLFVLLLLTFWVSRSVQLPAQKLDGSSRHDPDYIVSNFVTTHTDKAGKLRYNLTAAEMRHFPDDDTTMLQRPRYTQFAINKPFTQIEGQRGHVSGNGKEVEFFDQVKVTRQAYSGKGEMTVNTEYLKIFPDTEIVQTHAPVVIRQAPKTIIYATGMLFEKKKNTVTLLHKVKAHYERPHVAVPIQAPVLNKPVAPAKPAPIKKKVTQPKKAPSQAKKLKNKSHPPSKSNNARIRRRYE